MADIDEVVGVMKQKLVYETSRREEMQIHKTVDFDNECRALFNMDCVKYIGRELDLNRE